MTKATPGGRRRSGSRPAAARVTLRPAWALCLLAGCGGEAEELPVGPPVGVSRVEYADSGRSSWLRPGEPRPLTTSVWYAAADGVGMQRVVIPSDRPVFDGGWAARDAEPATSGPAPLVVLSHGTGGSGFQTMWLGRELAARGYVVAAVDHHGNTAAEPRHDARGFRMVWERATDLSRVIDHLLADPRFGPLIDRERIGAAGFSLGGYTVTALAGGQTDLDRLERFCAGPRRDATCEPPPEYPEAIADFRRMLEDDASLRSHVAEHGASFRDPRVRSIVAMAPAPAQVLTPESLREIGVPMLIVVGTADDVAPAATNAGWLAENVPGARVLTIEGAGHYEFLNPCTPRGRRFVPVCRDSGPDRTAVHAEVSDWVADHFARTLGPGSH